jgi:outer membrane protein assembly factor BamB
MAKPDTLLYLGTNRSVVAIEPQTGAERWRTRLPHSGGSTVTVLVGRTHLFVGHAGRAYCLDRRSGSIIWENGLPRMGFYPVLLARDAAVSRQVSPLYIGTNRYVAALETRGGSELWRNKLPHAGSAIVSLLAGDACLFVGHAGYVYGLDKRLGSILWENGLPRLGYHPVLPAMEGFEDTSAGAAVAAYRAQQQRQAAGAAAAGA